MNKYFQILMVLAFFSCQNKQESIKPQKGIITESVYASGFVKSKNQYKVFPGVNGTLMEIYVEEGDSVNVGTPLFRIYNSTAKLNREQAKIGAELNDLRANQSRLDDLLLNVENAKNKMENDSVLLIRQRNLWSQQIGTKVEFEQRELSYWSSKNLYESTLLRYNDLKRQLDIASRQSKNTLLISESVESEFVVKSQIKGKVYSLLSELGEFASVQIPLAIIGDSERFVIEMLIDEYDIAMVKEGQKVFVNMDSHKNETFEAVLKRILPIMNERSKSFTVEAEFMGNLPLLYPNLTVEANIMIRKKDNALTVPRKYLKDDLYLTKKNGETVKVQIGLKDYQKVEILSGFSENDELILPKP